MAGRDTKLTSEVQKSICDFLRVGNTRKAAANAAGIGERTLYTWLELGEKEEEDGVESGQYRQFRQALIKSEGECEAHKVAMIQKAGADRKVVTTRTKTKTYREATLGSDGKPLVGKDGKVIQREVTETETVKTEGFEFDWRADAWWLERRRRADYGNSIDIRKLDDETLLGLLERAAQEGGEPNDDTKNIPTTS